jgi:hypothetical protein
LRRTTHSIKAAITNQPTQPINWCGVSKKGVVSKMNSLIKSISINFIAFLLLYQAFSTPGNKEMVFPVGEQKNAFRLIQILQVYYP